MQVEIHAQLCHNKCWCFLGVYTVKLVISVLVLVGLYLNMLLPTSGLCSLMSALSGHEYPVAGVQLGVDSAIVWWVWLPLDAAVQESYVFHC